MSRIALAAAVAVTLPLTACGGGGGGTSAAKQRAEMSSSFTASGSNIIQKLITYYTDGSQTIETAPAFISSYTVDPDHVRVTGTMSRSLYSSQPLAPYVIEPSISTAPTITAAQYPSNWTTGGAVTAPHVSAAAGIFFDGTAYHADGTSNAPFRQQTLTPNGPRGANAINDPNAYVVTNSQIYADHRSVLYDLRWGTPDPAGPGYAALYSGGDHTFSNNYSWFGHTLNAYCCASPCSQPLVIGAPLQDVLDAYNQVWTGKGSNVLIWDSFAASQNVNPSGKDYHGAITSLITWRYATGASLYGLDALLGLHASLSDASIIDKNGTKVSSYSSNANANNSKRQNNSFYFDVVNMSFGWDYQGSGRALPQLQSDASSFITYVTPSITRFTGLLNGTTASTTLDNSLTPGSASVSFKDAVLTVAAGNEAIRSDWAPLPYLITHDSILGPNSLIVGALDKAGQPGTNGGPGTASIYAKYTGTDGSQYGSNTAGYDLTVQNRFLVASGINPLASTIGGSTKYGISVDGNPTSTIWGTSYAAPRVAGYAAIVRQKFPNLTAPNTADILLATARYDTLSCYPNCDKAIYGQGEASLSRALAPVGYLR